jgi:glycosyltransferase involved in cell wall biosynthesis
MKEQCEFEKNNLIKVSVIIPIYNMEKYIEQCISSIINQTLHEIEIICVDDGSTDSSLEILKKFAIRDKRIIIYQQQNSGVAVARNKGIELARGEYLSILDADDFFDKDMLLNSYNSIKNLESDICVFRTMEFNELDGTTDYLKTSIRDSLLPTPDTFVFTPEVIQDRLFSIFTLWAWDKLFKTSFIKKNKILFQNQRTTNDAGFVAIALALSNQINICNTAFAIHRYNRKDSLSVTREKSWNCFNEAFKFIESRLTKEGLFDKYYHAMQNWVLDFSIWNLITISGVHKEDVFNLIKNEVFVKYQIWENSKDYFVFPDRYEHSKLIQKYSFSKYLREYHRNEKRNKLINKFKKLNRYIKSNGVIWTAVFCTKKIIKKIIKH